MAEKHADTREYLLVHQSLRVTLDRFVDATAKREPVELATVIGPRWRLFARGLHTHHEHEDDAFFPAIASHCPDVAPLVAQLTEEHHELVALLDVVDRAVDAFEAQPDAAHQQAVHDAIAAVRDQLVPHLDVEDAKLLPAAAATVDAREWKRLSRDAMRAVPKQDLPIVAGILDEVARSLPSNERPPPPPLLVRFLIATSWRKRYVEFVAPLTS
jgi:hypothetical protein